MKFILFTFTLTTLGLASPSFASCGSSLDQLYFASMEVGAISAAIPENLQYADQLKEKLAIASGAEKQLLKSSMKECSTGDNADACSDAVFKYSRASREIGFVLTNGKNEPRPDSGKHYADSMGMVVEMCLKK